MNYIFTKLLKKYWLPISVGVFFSIIVLGMIIIAPITSVFQAFSFLSDGIGLTNTEEYYDAEVFKDSVLESLENLTEEQKEYFEQIGIMIDPEKLPLYFEVEDDSYPKNETTQGKIWTRELNERRASYYTSPSGRYEAFEQILNKGDIAYPHRLWWHSLMGFDVVMNTAAIKNNEKTIDTVKQELSPSFQWSNMEKWIYTSSLTNTKVYHDGELHTESDHQIDMTYLYPIVQPTMISTMFKDYIYSYSIETTAETGWEELPNQTEITVHYIYRQDSRGGYVKINGEYEVRTSSNSHTPTYDITLPDGTTKTLGGNPRTRYKKIRVETVKTKFQRTKIVEPVLLESREVSNTLFEDFCKKYNIDIEADPLVMYAMSKQYPDSLDFTQALEIYMRMPQSFMGAYLPRDLKEIFLEAEELFGLPWWYIAGVAHHESNGTFNPKITNGKLGDDECIGIMQVNYNLWEDTLAEKFGEESLEGIRNNPRMQILHGTYILRAYLNKALTGTLDYTSVPDIDWTNEDDWKQATLNGMVYYGGWLTKGPMDVARNLCREEYANPVWKYAAEYKQGFGIIDGSLFGGARPDLTMVTGMREVKRSDVLAVALTMVGRQPYRWGGNYYKRGYPRDGYGLDCSGYVAWVINQFAYPRGKSFPSGTANQFPQLLNISEGELKPGDLMFKQYPSNPGINHVGIYMGTAYDLDENPFKIVVHENGTDGNVAVTAEKYSGIEYTGTIGRRHPIILNDREVTLRVSSSFRHYKRIPDDRYGFKFID